jgi:tetratricopeptide (TPR) repeat protein
MMRKKLDLAINLRNAGRKKVSNELLVKLVEKFPGDAFINYQCAWSFDLLGDESAAVPFYENAINLGLSGKDLEGALVGLGSTYRTLGEYEKSKQVLLKGMDLFPNNKAIQVFYSLTLYNLKDHDYAMELLLTCLIDTSSDKEILNYKKALNFYSDKLNEIWN